MREEGASRDAIDLTDILGRPFKRGGRGPDVWDCWGVVLEVGRRMGQDIPDLAGVDWTKWGDRDTVRAVEREQHNCGWDETGIPERGAVIFLGRSPTVLVHAGIFVAPDLLAHSTEATGVVVQQLRAITGLFPCRRIARWKSASSSAVTAIR